VLSCETFEDDASSITMTVNMVYLLIFRVQIVIDSSFATKIENVTDFRLKNSRFIELCTG
jgi:hypothetical protein